jgi:hypothetical protein
MGYVSARQTLETVKSHTPDAGMHAIAVALVQLTRAIEADFVKIEKEMNSIKVRLR